MVSKHLRRRRVIGLGICALACASGCPSKSSGGNKAPPSSGTPAPGADLGLKLKLTKRSFTLHGSRVTIRVPAGWKRSQGRESVSWSPEGLIGDKLEPSVRVSAEDGHPKSLAFVKEIHDPRSWGGKRLRAEVRNQTTYVHTAVGPTGIGAAHGRKETQVVTTVYFKLPSEAGIKCEAGLRRSPAVQRVAAAQRFVEALCLSLKIHGSPAKRRAPPPPSPSRDVAVPTDAKVPPVRCRVNAKRWENNDWEKIRTTPQDRSVYLSLLMERCRGFTAYVQASFNVVLKRDGVKHQAVKPEAIPRSFSELWNGLCKGATKVYGAPRTREDLRKALGRLYDHCKLARFNLLSRAEFANAQFPGTLVPAIYWSLRRGGLAERHARGLARLLIGPPR